MYVYTHYTYEIQNIYLQFTALLAYLIFIARRIWWHIARIVWHCCRSMFGSHISGSTQRSGCIEIVWRVRGKIIRSVLCNIVCNNCAQCSAHTYEHIHNSSLDWVLSHWSHFTVLRFIFTARRSYASAVLGVVILSVHLSVCPSVRLSHAYFVTYPKNLPAIFLYHMKGQSFSFLPPNTTVVGGRRFLPPKMGDRSDLPPSKIAHQSRFYAAPNFLKMGIKILNLSSFGQFRE